MVKIKFKDGSIKDFENVNALDIAEKISVSLRKKVIAAKLDDKYIELDKIIKNDGEINLIVADDEDKEALHVLRHSCAHLLAQALRRIYGKVTFGVGPSIENGFYYDFDCEYKITEEDLKNIEKEMKKIISENLKVVGKEVSREEAKEIFKNDPYKLELIDDLPIDEKITT